MYQVRSVEVNHKDAGAKLSYDLKRLRETEDLPSALSM